MNNTRNVYLKMLPLGKARRILLSYFNNNLPKEILPTNKAVGRVLAEPIPAKISSPHFNAAAMDGIAVKAEDTFEACEANPQELVLGKNGYYINTGQVLPEHSNAVIMIEHVQILNENKFKIENPAFPWQNVRKIGEDIIATELLYTENHEITPYCIGALISAGIYEIPVIKKPRILIIPTGSELVDWTNTRAENLRPGQVVESNSYVLEKMVESCGGLCRRTKTIIDDFELIKDNVLKAIKLDFDIILTLGGSSAGSQDYALKIADNLGKVLIHGVTIMPGKPILVADIDSKPFFGIPGYPVSAIIAFEQFVRPLIRKMLRIPDIQRETVNTVLSRKVASKLGMEEFLRVKLGKIGKKIVATPLPRGAGTITSITEADGIIRIPRQTEGIEDNRKVETELLKPILTINNTIMAVGSHDNSLNILANELKKVNTKLNFSSSHVGSMGGLVAIKKGLCHTAGVHLLNETTGEYNIPYIKQYLYNVNVKLINLVMRDQGIIISKGNPKNITGIKDLERKDVVFINRQKGSGTRILLDYKLSQAGILAKNIKGYCREEFTHMDVAMAVLSKSADATLGIYSASKALNLDFIPIANEQYDLIVRKETFNSDKIRTVMEIICSQSFKNKVYDLGGYSTENTGKILM